MNSETKNNAELFSLRTDFSWCYKIAAYYAIAGPLCVSRSFVTSEDTPLFLQPISGAPSILDPVIVTMKYLLKFFSLMHEIRFNSQVTAVSHFATTETYLISEASIFNVVEESLNLTFKGTYYTPVLGTRMYQEKQHPQLTISTALFPRQQKE
jgi:hypothetical protein